MFATFVIRTGDPVRSLAVPLDGVVREGDGTMTVWVTTDRRRFTRRTVKIGLQRDGYRPDSRRPAARRTGGDRRRVVPEQRARHRSRRSSHRMQIAVLKGLVAFGLTRRPIILLCLLVFVGGGLVAFSRLNIEAYPNPAPVILEITAQAAGQSAEEMERYYTIPDGGRTLPPRPGVDIIRSTSFYGLSFVRVTFNYGIDYYFAVTQAALSLQQNVSLPNGVMPADPGDRAWSARSIATRWSARRISG